MNYYFAIYNNNNKYFYTGRRSISERWYRAQSRSTIILEKQKYIIKKKSDDEFIDSK